jgi:hypothetical protein
MKNFDLNIDKILENWEVFHAVRELIANAIDEQILTKTQKPMIFQDETGWWHVRDFGRGLRYQDLIQTENPEKLEHANLIGKFGIGLKDALATFDRRACRCPMGRSICGFPAPKPQTGPGRHVKILGLTLS